MAQSINELGQLLMERELKRDPEQFKPKPFDLGLQTGPEMKPIDPHLLATVGGLADAATTYAFLKTGRGHEGNALVGFTHDHPEATALAALGGLAASKGITSLINRFSSKAADALAANLGALQSAYAVTNLGLTRARGGNNSSREYQLAMTNKVVNGK